MPRQRKFSAQQVASDQHVVVSKDQKISAEYLAGGLIYFCIGVIAIVYAVYGEEDMPGWGVWLALIALFEFATMPLDTVLAMKLTAKWLIFFFLLGLLWGDTGWLGIWVLSDKTTSLGIFLLSAPLVQRIMQLVKQLRQPLSESVQAQSLAVIDDREDIWRLCFSVAFYAAIVIPLLTMLFLLAFEISPPRDPGIWLFQIFPAAMMAFWFFLLAGSQWYQCFPHRPAAPPRLFAYPLLQRIVKKMALKKRRT